jgi:flagellar basal-body rod protein FlgF
VRMIRGIYTAASGMLADQRRLDVIANNIANSSTSGYKRDTSVTTAFDSFMVIRTQDNEPVSADVKTVGQLTFGSLISHTATRLTTGSLIATGNPLDVAVSGDGFFAISTQNGIRYTRDGSFKQREDGVLTTQAGDPVLVDGREVSGGSGTLSINNNGTVTAGDQVLGRLSIATSVELGSIRKEGAGFWMPIGPGEPSALVQSPGNSGGFVLSVGYVESSNVEPVTEMVEMITTMRSYEANQRAIQMQDEALGKAVSEIARVS